MNILKSLLVATLIVTPTTLSNSRTTQGVDLPVQPESETEENKKKQQLELAKFLNKLGHLESSGYYQSVSKYGYLGKYQFSFATLKFLGINTTRREFLADTALQDSAAVKYLKFNAKVLSQFIETYDGKTAYGIKISKGGILAGAHLTGAGGVIEFFMRKGKYKTTDANGVHVSKYIKQFSSYQLKEI